MAVCMANGGEVNADPELADGNIVRGIEICHYNGFTRTWDVVGKFAPTELAARQAATDVKWLRDRHPYDRYELRALLSVPSPQRPAVIEADSEPANSTPTLE